MIVFLFFLKFRKPGPFRELVGVALRSVANSGIVETKMT
jgi:hypothetical protein